MIAWPEVRFGDAETAARDQLLSHAQISGASVSPDGEHVLAVVTTWEAPASGHERLSHVWLGPARGDRPFIRVSGRLGGRAPAWAPDGVHIAFISSAPEIGGTPQVWCATLGSGAPRRVTSITSGVAAFAWAPDSNRLSVVTRAGGSRARVQGPVVWSERRHPESHLRIVALSGDVTRMPAPTGHCLVGGPEWSPCGRFIAVLCEAAAEEDVANQSLWILHSDGAGARCVASGLSDAQAPSWSPNGRVLAAIAAAPALERSRGVTVPDLSANFRLLFVDVESGMAEEASNPGDWHPIPQLPRWSPDGERVYFTIGVQMHREIASCALGGPILRETVGVQCTLGNMSEGRVLAMTCESALGGPEVYVWSPERGGEPRRVSSFNQEGRPAEVHVSLVSWPGADGLPIQGLLLRPSKTPGGVAPPCLTVVHGGPMDAHCADYKGGSSELGLLWVRRGWAVLYPNPRGSTNYGAPFMAAAIGDLGGQDLRDIVKGVEALGERGLIDSDRCVISGWSYGGYIAALAAFTTSRFQAAIAGGGVYNLVSMYGTSNLPGPIAGYMRAAPDESTICEYMARSPIQAARHDGAPLLLLHGERDSRAPVSQAQEMYRACCGRGAVVELVTYPDEGHGFGRLSNLSDRFARQWNWANTYTYGEWSPER